MKMDASMEMNNPKKKKAKSKADKARKRLGFIKGLFGGLIGNSIKSSDNARARREKKLGL